MQVTENERDHDDNGKSFAFTAMLATTLAIATARATLLAPIAIYTKYIYAQTLSRYAYKHNNIQSAIALAQSKFA